MAGVPGALFFAHMRDGPMIRIRLPGGKVGAGQLRAIADLAAQAGNDRIALTNLSNFQVLGLEWIGFSHLKRHLDSAGLLPDRLWADRRRNILGDPLSGLVEGELYPAQTIIKRLDDALQAEPLMKASSLKFGFVVDGGGPSQIGGQLHDAALIAEKQEQEVWFRLYLTGHATPFIARPDDAPGLALAAATAALSFPAKRDTGWLKGLKRLAYGRFPSGPLALPARIMLALAGPQDTRIRRLLNHVPVDDLIAQIRTIVPSEKLKISQAQPAKAKLTPSIGIIEQKDPGKVICGFGITLGKLDSRSLKRIADMAEKYGTGELRLSPWHVVFIPHVESVQADALLKEAQQAGFMTGEQFLSFDLSACSGRSGCRGARLETQDHALAVMDTLNKYMADGMAAPVSIHISGCPKGCAHRQPSDILALEREDASGYYLYEDSAALTPDISKRFNGSVSTDELPDTVCALVRKRGLASGASSRHKPPDTAAV